MSDVTTKVKNNPSCFAKEAEITNGLFAINIGQKNSGRMKIISPKLVNSFDINGEGGIPLFYDKISKNVYVDHTDKHSLIIGSTGSKKSRLLAMPAILSLGAAHESIIISDPKAELFLKTSQYLKNLGYNVVSINLREPQYGFAWNPLTKPYEWFLCGDTDRAYEFANDIAINLTSSNKSESDPFWENSAGSFFFGLILLLFKYCKDYNLSGDYVNVGNVMELRHALCSINPSLIRDNPWWKYAKTDSFIASTLIGTIETANDTRAGILSVFDQKMRSLAIQPSLLNMLAYNNIDYDMITQQPTAIFLIMPDEKTGFHGLVSLFIKQSYEFLVYRAQKKLTEGLSCGNRVNYILDEFSSLPTIVDFPAMITAARSRNIRFNLFLQSKHQLKLRYKEEADTIMANCENWIFLTSREIDFLHELSELCGNTNGSQGKPLLSTSELQRLDKSCGEALLLHGRLKPFITKLADIDEYGISSTTNKSESNIKSNLKNWQRIDFSSLKRKSEILKLVADEPQEFIPGVSDSELLAKSIERRIAELKGLKESPFAKNNNQQGE